LILYSGTKNASSWSFRAWLALKEAGLSFDEEIIDLRKPARDEGLAFVGRFSPSASVPALIDDETVVFDSMAIMEYANELGGGFLLPEERKARAVARSLLAWQHGGLSRLCSALSFESAFYETKRTATRAEKAEGDRLLGVWSHCLRGSGGPYLTGPLSLADLAFVPTVIRIFSHMEVPAIRQDVKTWMDMLLQRRPVLEWMEEANQLPPIYLPEYLDNVEA
jgi:glutathione S-transferase